jgi:hypothetical protein
MVQVDPLVQVEPTLAYAKKYAHRGSCVINTEQSRGFKCGICLGMLPPPFGPQRPPLSSLCAGSEHSEPSFDPGSGAGTHPLRPCTCTELLNEPVSTPCGHNFCADCLRHAMVCAPRCPLCREQVQGPFRVNHVLEDMIALLQIQSPMKPSPGLKSSRGFGKPWQDKEPPRDGSRRSGLPNLSSPRQPLQQLSDQPQARQAEAQPRQGLNLAEIRPPSPRLALSSWLPAIAPSVPQALVPIQYTRRVPTEVPTLEEAVRDALPGTIVLLARGTHTLASPLIINKQVRIKGGSEP